MVANLDEFVGQVVAEDLTGAVQEVGAVLCGGKGKHPPQSWKKESYQHQLEKLEGHLIRTGREWESGRLHLAHTICRALMALQMELNEGQ